jgi:hypothetical protein
VANYPEPTDLGPRAMALWEGITSKYTLRIDEMLILHDACREVDLIERMEEQQKKSKLLGTGAQGQPVVAPLVPELRQHRSMLAGLMKQLHLPDVDGRPAQSTTDKARKAANTRWGNVS